MINCRELAYVTYRVTDLDVMESFLTDFGMTRSARSDNELYMRGAGTAHHVHVSIKGESNEFVGAAFEVDSEDDLVLAAEISNASPVEDIDGPAGGRRVRLTTPSGQRIDVVHGQREVEAVDSREPYQLNFFRHHRRLNQALRPKRAPSPVQRIGHFVLWSPEASADIEWFMEHFGLVASDYICLPGDESHVLGAFLRFDRGAEYVDHHVLLISQSERQGCHHSSFEVTDIDSVFTGHEYLAQQGHNLDAGVGRHLLGSLVFDYWWDPFGNRIEHYTDADIVNESHVPTRFTGTAEETTQWGAVLEPAFFE